MKKITTNTKPALNLKKSILKNLTVRTGVRAGGPSGNHNGARVRPNR